MIVGGVLANCAATGPDDIDDVNDPLESYNRVVFDFNQAFDGAILKPVAELYAFILPTWVQQRVSNILQNLGEPVNIANNLLQWKLERAGVSFGRFAINTTIGVGGIFEVADEFGLKHSPEDFGQTLAVWGVAEGPYLHLPVLGPSNPRDLAGFVVDTFLDPFFYLFDDGQLLARTVVNGVDRRADNLETLETLQETSIDFYATLRELYRQFRDSAIRDGELPETMPVPSVDFDDEEY